MPTGVFAFGQSLLTRLQIFRLRPEPHDGSWGNMQIPRRMVVRQLKRFEGFRPPTTHDWLKTHHAMKRPSTVRTIILAGSLLLQLRAFFHLHSRGAGLRTAA